MIEKICEFGPGIMVRNMNESIFDSGDEFNHLIFITTGSTKEVHGGGFDEEPETYYISNTVDFLTGEIMRWGTHMVSTVDSLYDWINGTKFLLDSSPYLREKIKIDSEQDLCLHRFDGASGMRVVNAIIDNARLICFGIDTGRYKVPNNVRSMCKLIAIDRLENRKDELLDLTMEISASSNIDHEKLDQYREELANIDSNETIEKVTDDVIKEMLDTIKNISNIEKFDIKSMTQIELEKYQRKMDESNEIKDESPV